MNSMNGIPNAIGPFLGGAIVSLWSFRTLCDIYMVYIFAFILLFFIVTNAQEIFRKGPIKAEESNNEETKLLVKEDAESIDDTLMYTTDKENE